MKNNSLDWLSKFLRYVLLIGSVAYIVVYLIVTFFQIRYPFELMWQEGASVDHVIRILSGYKYYDRPSIEFVASIYTPLYFYLSALLSKVVGIGFLPLRLISFFSSLGCFLVIYLMVRKETGSLYSGVVAAGLFAATYHVSGSWFNIGRSDSLFLFLLLIALYILRFYESQKFYFLAGALISLSFFTKQTALMISLPIMLYCILINRRLAVSFIVPIVIIAGFGSILLNYFYDGWLKFYVFDLPRTTPVDKRYLLNFWLKDIFTCMFIAFPVAVFYIISWLRCSNKKDFLFYSLVAVGMLTASWYSRFRGGGFYNVLLPAYAIISILFGLGLNRLLEISESFAADKKYPIKFFVYLVCIMQFSSGTLMYNPFDQVPTKKDIEAGRKFIDKISQIKGEVFIPYHGYLSVMAGKKSYANMMGLRDVITTSENNHKDIKDKFIDELKQAMKEKKFAAIIIGYPSPWYPPDMEKYYVRKEHIFDEDNVFFPITGMITRPQFIYVPSINRINSQLRSSE